MPRTTPFWIAIFCGWIFGAVLPGAEPGSGAQQPAAGAKLQLPPKFPPTPALRSPVSLFRNLLRMSPDERAETLAKKPEAQRRYIETKLSEYELLRPDERELRLRLVELQWYLIPLLTVAPDQRAERLKSIPAAERDIIDSRLNEWDQLSAELHQQILQHEPAMEYVLRFSTAESVQRNAVLQSLSAEQRRRLEQQLAQWHALPPEQRHKMLGYFDEFFDLPAKEKAKTLDVLSNAEREQMESVLQSFQRLPPAQRRLCIDSFQKFASMSASERTEFLKNAARWQTMTPSERDNWRHLVTQLPPFPPGMGEPPLPPPRPVQALPLASSNTLAQ
jgi:Protein of unknown function (DUF3106)